MKKKTKAKLFLELAKPDDQGFSRKVLVSEFRGKYSGLKFGNGGSWCRRESSLAQKYNVRKIKIREKGAIYAVELHGLNKTPITRPINAEIRRKIKEMRCVVLGTSNPECDHKDGRLDDPRLSDVKRQTISDFQPLSKAANVAKRQHCKSCRETGKRFDARKLGYKMPQIKGDEEYRGSCVGCYWYDPKEFNEMSSR